MNILIKLTLLVLFCNYSATIFAANAIPNNKSNNQPKNRVSKRTPKYDKQFAQAIEYLFRNDIENAKKLMTAAADRGVKPAYWYSYILTNDPQYLILAAQNKGKRAYTDAAVAWINKSLPNTSFFDYLTAYNWYLEAAKEQVTEQALVAMCNIGLMYIRGEGPISKDYNKSMKWYQKAADQLFPRALREIGIMYSNMTNKTSVKKEQAVLLGQAYSHFAIAAIKGDTSAYTFMNQPIKIAIPKADESFVEAIKDFFATNKFNDNVISKLNFAASQQHLFANILLGDYYLNSNLQLAIKYYEKAANKGSFYAKDILAKIPTYKDNIKYCKELADLGYRVHRHNYAILLEKQGNTQLAYELYQQNADEGDAHSQLRMFNLIMVNKVKKFSMFKGLTYLIEAGKQHFGDAEVTMGGYLVKDFLKLAPEDAMTLLMKGIIDGVSTPQLYDIALDDIADGFAYGYGVKKDVEFAKQLCFMRIKNNSIDAYLDLGLYYEKGIFGKVDLENAKKYYTLGANKGNKFCIEALKRITKKENK